MRVGMPASVALHGALLGFAFLSFQNAKPKDEIVFVDAIDAVPIAEESVIRAGKTTAPDKPEPSPREQAAAAKESAGERAGTARQELPAPKPPVLAALPEAKPEPPKPPEPVNVPEPKVEPKAEPKAEPVKAPAPPKPPEPVKPPEPKAEPVKAPDPAPAPKPAKPAEAEKARDVGEGSPPEVKPKPDKKPEPEKKPEPKDKAALDKIIEAETKRQPDDKKPEQKPVEKKPEASKTDPRAPEKKLEAKSAVTTATAPTAATAPRAAATATAKAPAAPQGAPAPTRFDPAAIAKSIQSRETAGTAAGPERKQATLGSPHAQAVAAKMSVGEIDALKGQIQRCWNPPPGAAEANITVTVRFSLKADGTLASQPEVVRAPAHPLGPPLAASARRAIIQCAPYRLPAEKFAVWQDIQPTFDPKDL